VLFLLNDVVFDIDARSIMPPLDARRFEAVSLSYVIELGKELFSEEPLLHRTAMDRARRLVALLSLKHPDINAALFVAPQRNCGATQVQARFCNLSIEVMASLHAKNSQGQLNAVAADREVWRRLAA
jgi:hypothetical protein